MTKPAVPKSIVVYVDDDPDDISLIEQSFMNLSKNIEIVTFQEGNHALSYLQNIGFQDPTPCLIILDINMPGLNGRDLLIRMRDNDHFKNVPIVLFSTSSSLRDKEFAKRYNAGFITKPLLLDQMNAITDQFIEHCSEEHQKNIRRGNKN